MKRIIKNFLLIIGLLCIVSPNIYAGAYESKQLLKIQENEDSDETIYCSYVNLVKGQFKGKTKVKEIVLLDNVTSLPDECFSGCTNLQSVRAKNVSVIGKKCFEGCNSLTMFNGLTIKNGDCFIVPEEWKRIDSEAFKGMEFAELIIEGQNNYSDFLSLEDRAFSGIKGLKKVYISRTSGIHTEFYYCRYEKILEESDCVSYNSSYFINPFGENPELEEVVFSDIYLWADEGCSRNLKTEDHYGSFIDDYEANDYFNKIQFNCLYPSIKRITIEGNCNKPVGIYNPEAEFYINAQNFGCSDFGMIPCGFADREYIQDLTHRWYRGWVIPWKYLRIGLNAQKLSGVSYFENLERIIVESPLPMEDENIKFADNVYTSALLVVPEGAEEAYRNSSPWNKFLNIKSADLSGVEEIAVSETSVEAEYYDLTGRKVDNPDKGVYILKDSRGVRKVIL